MDRDGRTDAEKDDDDYREYRSIWPGSRDTNWEEYESASLLNTLNFDSGRATYALLMRGERNSVLTRCASFGPGCCKPLTKCLFTDVRLSLTCNGGRANGLAAPYRDELTGKIVHRVCINVEMVWPLLVPTFTASEKAASHTYIAKVLLHELVVSTCNDL